jgi:hypothetical protein
MFWTNLQSIAVSIRLPSKSLTRPSSAEILLVSGFSGRLLGPRDPNIIPAALASQYFKCCRGAFVSLAF